ncbi:MAG: hypothetical protein Q7R64_02405 [bacterium]|nr:hypothetical protein [bacterium]
MNKKDALLTIGLVVVIVGGFFLFNREELADVDMTDTGATYVAQPKSTVTQPALPTGTSTAKPKAPVSTTAPAPAPTPVTSAPIVRLFENGQYVTIVNLTNTGFVPEAVSIAKGESIRFVNRSGSAMRILSSTEYAGLSQEKSVGLGGTYELTFPSAGSWTFSNGQTAKFFGVVTVK